MYWHLVVKTNGYASCHDRIARYIQYRWYEYSRRVAVPTPDFSHLDVVSCLALDSNVDIDTGWIGRYLDFHFAGPASNYPDPNIFLDPLAIQIGS